jgi:hypothetical protein
MLTGGDEEPKKEAPKAEIKKEDLEKKEEIVANNTKEIKE